MGRGGPAWRGPSISSPSSSTALCCRGRAAGGCGGAGMAGRGWGAASRHGQSRGTGCRGCWKGLGGWKKAVVDDDVIICHGMGLTCVRRLGWPKHGDGRGGLLTDDQQEEEEQAWHHVRGLKSTGLPLLHLFVCPSTPAGRLGQGGLLCTKPSATQDDGWPWSFRSPTYRCWSGGQRCGARHIPPRLHLLFLLLLGFHRLPTIHHGRDKHAHSYECDHKRP